MLVVMLAAQPAAAQPVDSAQIWSEFARQLEVGAALQVRLRNGQTFRATLVQARPEALLLQPKTRVAVPVQPVAYAEIVSLERVRGGGIGAGRAALIGVASGAATFFAILLILVGAIDD
jgi:hypothetical protein